MPRGAVRVRSACSERYPLGIFLRVRIIAEKPQLVLSSRIGSIATVR
jgi:hypothetical protein